MQALQALSAFYIIFFKIIQRKSFAKAALDKAFIVYARKMMILTEQFADVKMKWKNKMLSWVLCVSC